MQLAQRKPLRWKHWNYGWGGYYFVTICTKWMRIHWFGEIKNQKMQLSIIGKIIEEEWRKTQLMRKNIIIDEWIIMPNHFHAIIIIRGDIRAEDFFDSHADSNSIIKAHCNPILRAHCNAPVREIKSSNKFGPQRNNIPSIIRGFKGASARRIHALGYTNFAWHRSYYDRIIRDELALNQIRKYIRDNPKNWKR